MCRAADSQAVFLADQMISDILGLEGRVTTKKWYSFIFVTIT